MILKDLAVTVTISNNFTVRFTMPDIEHTDVGILLEEVRLQMLGGIRDRGNYDPDSEQNLVREVTKDMSNDLLTAGAPENAKAALVAAEATHKREIESKLKRLAATNRRVDATLRKLEFPNLGDHA